MPATGIAGDLARSTATSAGTTAGNDDPVVPGLESAAGGVGGSPVWGGAIPGIDATPEFGETVAVSGETVVTLSARAAAAGPPVSTTIVVSPRRASVMPVSPVFGFVE